MRTTQSLFTFLLLFFTTYSFSQNEPTWRELRANGANFYAIKAAFLRAHEAKLRDSTRTNKTEKDGDYAQFMRWANWVEPRVSGYGGNLNAITEGTLRALAERSNEIEPRTSKWEEVGYKTTPLDYKNTKGANGRVNAIRFHPTDPNILYACTPAGGLWKSVNKGGSWTPISDKIAALGCTDVAIHPQNPQIMWLATGDGYGLTPGNVGNAFNNGGAKSLGVYMTIDGGTTWTPTSISYQQSNNVNHFLSRIIVNPNNPKVLLVGGSGGISRSEDGGKIWVQVDVAGVLTRRIWDVEFKPDDPEIVYAVSSSQFFRSDNGGKTWTQITSGLPIMGAVDPNRKESRMTIAISKDNPQYVYAVIATNQDYDIGSPTGKKTVNGLYAVYQSINAGKDFTRAYPSANPDTRKLYANDYLNILGSQENGVGDDKTGGYGQADYCFALAVSPTNPEKIYVGGIQTWASENSGNSWQLFSWSDDDDRNVHADIQDLAFSGSTLYAASDGGVYMKEGSNKWKNISSNLAVSQPYRIDVSQTNENYVVNALQDNGVNFTTGGIKWQKILGGDGENALIYRADPNIFLAALPNGYVFKVTISPLKVESLVIDNLTINNLSDNFATITPMLHDPNNTFRIYIAGKKIYTLLNLTTDNVFKTFTESPSVSSQKIKYMDIREGLVAGERIVYTISDDNQIRVGKMSLSDFTIAWKTISPPAKPSSWPATMTLGAITSITASKSEPDVVYMTYSNYEGVAVFRSANRGDTWESLHEGLPKVPVNCLISPKSLTETLYVGTDIGIWYRNRYTGKWLPHNANLPIVPIYDLKIQEATNKLYAATFGRGVWRSDIDDLSSPDIENGLIANYPFNINADDVSGNDLHGVPHRVTKTQDRFGNPDKAYNFNGRDAYISFAKLPTSQLTNMSVSLWIRPTDLNQLGIALNYGYDDGDGVRANGFGIGIANGAMGAGNYPINGNKLQFLHCGVEWLSGNYTFSDINKWVHVVILRDAGVSKIYINANLVITHNNPIKIPTELTVGSASNIRFFNGDIDDIRIYNRAISPEEIKLLYGQDLGEGLVAHYPFNGNANDESGNNYHVATNKATLTKDRFGKSNSAYHFDGTSSYMEVPHNTPFVSENHTVSAWIKTSKSPDWGRIVVLPENGDQHFSLNVNTATPNKASIYFDKIGGGAIVTYSNKNVTDGVWHHLVGVINLTNKQMSMYVDGVLENTTQLVNTPITATKPLQIGRFSAAEPEYFEGDIDDIRIYNRGISPEEVKMLYKNTDKGADLTFDGKNDYVDMGKVLNMGTNDFTVESWFNAKDFQLAGTDARIILIKGASFCSTPQYAGYGLYAHNVGGSNSIEFNVSNTIVKATNLQTDRWYHVAGVRQGNQISIFLDGKFVQSASTGSIVSTNNNDNFSLGTLMRPAGSLCGANTLSFNGTIDEVRIWNKAVNPCDIDANRTCELKGNETGLVAYYKFNQGYANFKNDTEKTLIDLAGGDQNGTLSNFDLQNTYSNWTNTDNTFLNQVCLTPIRQISKIIKCGKSVLNPPKTKAEDIVVNVFPNPFLGSIVVEYELPEESPVFISITNMFGQIVHTVTKPNGFVGSQQEEIPLSILPEGLYFVKLKTDFGEVMTKIFKNK